MQAHCHAEDAKLELSGPKRRSRVAFGRSRALECTASGTMLSARRSRSFASGSRGARLLLKQRVEKLSAKMQALRHTEDANLELCGAKRRSRAAYGRSCPLESTATGTMLSARRSRFFASEGRRTRPLLSREERRRTTLAFSAQPSNSSGTVPFQSLTF
ncbi:unnamed protein product [Coccothraustes coccothraustes]